MLSFFLKGEPMETKIIRNQIVIKKILKYMNVLFDNQCILLLRLNHKKKTAKFIINFNTLENKKTDYKTIINLI